MNSPVANKAEREAYYARIDKKDMTPFRSTVWCRSRPPRNVCRIYGVMTRFDPTLWSRVN